jgi:hypothetical protein
MLYDLTSLTGATITDVNEAGTLGGFTESVESAGYLRYLDGRTLAASRAAVQAVGSAGHFGGSIRTSHGYGLFFGAPDGTVNVVNAFGRFAGVVNDVNRHGAFVGHNVFILFGLGTAGILYRDGRLSFLSVGRDDVNVQVAHAINDLGYILASARIASAPASSVLLAPVTPLSPSGLSFAVTGHVVTLTWTTSHGAVDYVVEAGSVPGAANLFNAAIGSEPRLTTPAPPGRYYVRVRARNDLGVSAPSVEVVIDVP